MFSFVKHLSPIPLIQNTWNQKCFKFWILSILENSQTHSDLRGEVRSLSIYVSHRPYTYSLHAGPLSGTISVSVFRPWRLPHVRSDGDFPSWRLADAQTTLFDFRLQKQLDLSGPAARSEPAKLLWLTSLKVSSVCLQMPRKPSQPPEETWAGHTSDCWLQALDLGKVCWLRNCR